MRPSVIGIDLSSELVAVIDGTGWAAIRDRYIRETSMYFADVVKGTRLKSICVSPKRFQTPAARRAEILRQLAWAESDRQSA